MNKYNKHTKLYVAVDCVIFTYEEEELKILLYPRGFEPSQGKWSLMGGFVEPDKTLENEAQKVLYNTVGLKDIFLEQVFAFSRPERDPGGRVISIAFYALMPIDYQDKELVRKHGAHCCTAIWLKSGCTISIGSSTVVILISGVDRYRRVE